MACTRTGARSGRLPPDDAAHAGRDRVGVRRDRRRSAGCSTRPAIRRPGWRCSPRAWRARSRPVFRQTAMNRFEDRVHTSDARSASVSVDHFGEPWQPDPGRAARRHGRDHRRLPHLVVVHPALHRHAGLRLRVRVRSAPRAPCTGPTRSAALSSSPSTSSSSRRWLPHARRARPHRRGRPRGPRLLERRARIVEQQLEAAETAAAEESGRL